MNRREALASALLGTGLASKVLGIDVIEPKPDEIYVIRFPHSLSAAAHARIREGWKRAWGPEAPKCMILEGGASIGVMKAGRR